MQCWQLRCHLKFSGHLLLLVLQVAREEQEELLVRQETPSLLQFDKKTDAKVVEEKKKSYLQQNSSTFSQLVAEAKARRDSKKSTAGDLKSSCSNAEICPENIAPETENSEERLKGGAEGVKSSRGLGVKRGAGDLSISSGVSSEKRARSGGREAAMSTSSKETHSSYFTSATHASSSVDPVKNLTGSPHRTPVKNSGGVGKLYVTPTKSFIQELAKSPKLKNGSIVDVLNRSSSQAKMVAKATCPVCNAQVTEKFLNIHLDKCLR